MIDLNVKIVSRMSNIALASVAVRNESIIAKAKAVGTRKSSVKVPAATIVDANKHAKTNTIALNLPRFAKFAVRHVTSSNGKKLMADKSKKSDVPPDLKCPRLKADLSNK